MVVLKVGVFHPYGDVTINGEGLQSLTYARHFWPLSSEVFQRAITTVIRDISKYWSSTRARANHNNCRAFLAVQLSLPFLTT